MPHYLGPMPRLLLPAHVIQQSKNWVDLTEKEHVNRDQFGVLLDPNGHKEKAAAVIGSVNGQEVVIVGGGAEWTEDQKDMIERLAESERRDAAAREQLAKERTKAFQTNAAEAVDRLVTYRKRNHRTAGK